MELSRSRPRNFDSTKKQKTFLNEFDTININKVIVSVCEKFHWSIEYCNNLTCNQIYLLLNKETKETRKQKDIKTDNENVVEKVKRLTQKFGRPLTPVELERIMLKG